MSLRQQRGPGPRIKRSLWQLEQADFLATTTKDRKSTKKNRPSELIQLRVLRRKNWVEAGRVVSVALFCGQPFFGYGATKGSGMTGVNCANLRQLARKKITAS
jgi:hypothetical protein